MNRFQYRTFTINLRNVAYSIFTSSPVYPIILLCFCCILFSCAPALKHYFPDTFYTQDRVYTNPALGFSLSFIGNWIMATDPKDMSKPAQTVLRELQQASGELLFSGYTVEGSQATRGIVEHLNLTDEAYLEQIRQMNATSIEKDLGVVQFQAGERLMLKWVYEYSGLRYAEFLFKCGTYNCRVAFWTKPQMFNQFEPVYEDIMNSINFTSAQ